jgi:proteasome lid subunit RPN8/RPN11
MRFTVSVRTVCPTPELLPDARVVRAGAHGAPVRVYVLDSAMDAVWRAVGAGPLIAVERGYPVAVERGGGLAGRYCVDPSGQRFIVVTEAVPAPSAPSTAAHIDIRAEDWIDIKVAIARRPDRRLLGWFHSHPGLGVWMSRTDRSTQRRTFGVDWQVGLVVDPWSGAFRFHIGPCARRAGWVGMVADRPTP